MLKRGLAVVAVVLGVLGIDAVAQAQRVHVTGPLAGEPAVRKLRMYRVGRFQIKPAISFSLQDEFQRTMLFGGQLTYHFLDYLGIGLWGGYGGVHLDTNLTDSIQQRGTPKDRNALSLPSRDFFGAQTGQINWVAAAQAVFAPLRGKISLFQKIFADTDFYFFAGVAAVGVEERANVDEGENPCGEAPPPGAMPADNDCIATQLASSSRVAVAPTFGVGMTFYVSEYAGITFEWRGLPFKWNTSGWDTSGFRGNNPDGEIDSDDRAFEFNQFVSLGAVFYLPTPVTVSE